MSGLPELPGVLAEIAELAGREAALKLALAMGGEQIHVPRPDNVKAGHPLAGAIGAPAAVLVSGRFAGESLYVPKARRALARHLHAKGTPKAAIAARLGVSIKTARQYVRGD